MRAERMVPLDALREGRSDIAALVAQLAEVEPPEVQVLHDGCGGDDVGLKELLKQPHVLLHTRCSDEGYGHHSYNEIILLADGRIVHAECGGCSCEGSGSWSICVDLDEADRLIPEQERQS